MKQSLFLKILFAVIFAFISLTAYGKITHKYRVRSNQVIYSEPSFDAKFVGRIKEGTIIETAPPKEGGWWIEVEHGGCKGYMHKSSLELEKVIRTGNDVDHYGSRMDSLAVKLGYPAHPTSDQLDEIYKTARIPQIIAVVLLLIAIILARIDSVIGAMCLLIIASLTITIQHLCLGHTGFILGWWVESEIVIMAVYFIMGLVALKAASTVLYSVTDFMDVRIRWIWGILASLAGAILFILDGNLHWNACDKLMTGFAIVQLLFCVHIAIACKSRLAIPLIFGWLLTAYVLLNLSFMVIAVSALIVATVVTLLFLGSVFSAAFGGTFITSSGTILKAIFGDGYVDLAGNLYHDVGGGKVAKDE